MTVRAKKQGQLNRTRQRILEATLALVSEHGYRSLTLEKISQSCGVSRSTIYRHWDAVPDIAMDAFQMVLGPQTQLPDTGDVRKDLSVLFRRLVKALTESEWGNVLPAILEASLQDQAFADLLYGAIKARRAPVRNLLRAAVRRGELPKNTKFDWLLDSITGAIYHRVFFTNSKLTERGMIDHWVNAAVDAAIKRGES